MGLRDFYIVSIEERYFFVTMIGSRCEICQSNKDFICIFSKLVCRALPEALGTEV